MLLWKKENLTFHSSQDYRKNLKAWVLAFRPKTLTAAVVPIFVGASLAYFVEAKIDWLINFYALMAALFIQIATNLLNDAIDFKKGCYVGQEVVSRMYRKTQIRKRFCAFSFDPMSAPEDDAKTLHLGDRVVGEADLALLLAIPTGVIKIGTGLTGCRLLNPSEKPGILLGNHFFCNQIAVGLGP